MHRLRGERAHYGDALMLGLDPEGPLPLDVIGRLPAQHALYMWERHGAPTPVSGDPHFTRLRDSETKSDVTW